MIVLRALSAGRRSERDLRPVKIPATRLRRMLANGPTDRPASPSVRSYLLTATKNGIETLDALTSPFTYSPPGE